jgi:hypothetical protein
MKTVLLILMSVSLSLTYGQVVGNKMITDQQRPLDLVFDQEEFQGRFSVKVTSDGDFDYYVVDLTDFSDRFERVYFVNLTYSQSKLVNMDRSVDKGQYWFKAYYTYKEEEITCIFKDLKEETLKVAAEMNPSEKSSWLSSNDKFKTKE